LKNEQYQELVSIADEFNVKLQPIIGEERTIYAIIGDERSPHLIKRIEGLPYVDRVDSVSEPYKLMSRQSNMAGHKVKVGNKVLGEQLVVIAGPCAIDNENKNLMLETAHAIREAGADMLRGGVWKPRTSPYAFQGNTRSLDILLEAREETGLPVNTEVMDFEQLNTCIQAKVDSLQIGARNALNYKLLQHVGEMTQGTGTNILLKRSIHMGPVNEFVLAAEYLVSQGNPNVIMCPRGTSPTIKEFRYMPDESITVLLKEKTWAPVIVDPSHSVGKALYVPNACLAAIGYGADGLLIETHSQPKKGVGDDPKQAVTPEMLERIIRDCKEIFSRSKKILSATIHDVSITGQG
jgi:3-deoxy-7-phosphoheptulonate synthase